MFWRTIQQSWAVSTFSSERQRLCLNLMAGKDCELCSARARLYCTSDAAFLCYRCDAHVHQANFLVARHCRDLLCARCAAFAGRSFSGGGAGKRDSPLCRSCSVADHKPAADEDVSDSESSSLTCASSPCASSAASGGRRGGGRRRRGGRPAGALETWCRRLGWGGRRRLAAAALRSLAAWRSATSAAMPMRVGLAAALWYAAGRRGGGAAELGRLERLSGVPARVIVWAEGRLRKLMMRMKPINNDGPKDNEEEGWAEC